MFSSDFRDEVRHDADRFLQLQADPAQGFSMPEVPIFSLLVGSMIDPGGLISAAEDQSGALGYAGSYERTLEDQSGALGYAGSYERTLLDRYLEHAGPIDIDGENYYLVEGDLLLDQDELDIYVRQQTALLRRQQATNEAQTLGYGRLVTPDPGALVGMSVGGRFVRWQPGFVLSYAVLRQTFLSDDQYDLVRTSMELATEEWENACGVKFEHLAALDGGDAGAEPVFTVRLIDAQGEFIASAFFPTDPPDRRRVLIDHSFFNDSPGSFDKVGVLRHELGHVLGFRHEHIRAGAPPSCLRESKIYGSTTATEVTPYDAKSVMHYLCGGAGSPELKLTELDVIGSQRIYGPPLRAVQFV